MSYLLIRHILGNEVFLNTENGKEYLMDFEKNKLIELEQENI